MIILGESIWTDDYSVPLTGFHISRCKNILGHTDIDVYPLLTLSGAYAMFTFSSCCSHRLMQMVCQECSLIPVGWWGHGQKMRRRMWLWKSSHFFISFLSNILTDEKQTKLYKQLRRNAEITTSLDDWIWLGTWTAPWHSPSPYSSDINTWH